MGRRKERRLAAQSGAGRRVKLDLFAEPSGDLGGSSVTDKVGEDIDPTQHAGLPKSPSSSGQQPENPLLLLGQYSDDDMDEESNKTLNQAFSDNSPEGYGNQERILEEGKDADVNAVQDLGDEKAIDKGMGRDGTPPDASQNPEGIDAGGDLTCFTDACKEMYPLEVNSVPGTSDAQVVGDVSIGWKIVLHEDSNQYYYWNTETGETSWEVPEVLAQATQLNLDQKTPDTPNAGYVATETNELSSVSGAELDNSLPLAAVDGSVDVPLASEGMQGTEQRVDELVEEQKNDPRKDKNWVANVDEVGLQNNSNLVNAALGDGSEYKNHPATPDELKEGTDLSASLVKQCESLLERLKSLRGFDGQPQAHDWRSTYILEVQIRLCDIRSLSAYGSSLLPFWVHSEKQLKQLEDLINTKIYDLAVSAQMDDDDDDDARTTTDSSSKEKERCIESASHESEPIGNDKSSIQEYSCPTNGENYLHEAAKRDAENPVQVSSLASPSGLTEGGPIHSLEVNWTSDMKPELYAGEDIDMDVDMDVEETIPGAIATEEGVSETKSLAAAEQPILTNPPAEDPFLAPGDLPFVPPPPEDEWIPPPPPDNDHVPPPPPDNEQVPPPPPDEPLESSCPHLETGQTFEYAHTYNLSYPDPSYQYYENALSIPSSNILTHSDTPQVAVLDPSLYYGEVPNTNAETASIVVPVGPVTYYGLQDGLIAPIPVTSNVDSSLLHAEVISYSAISSCPTGSSNPSAEVGSNVKFFISPVGGETDLASTAAPTASASSQIPGSVINMKESGPGTSNDVSIATADEPPPVTAVKSQSKALRSKKRTLAAVPSLRSNKKVSSLVDKWKAVKEELHENEEEPENAYEILEKKRQREIEEWKAKQIASGEAKDNANFQPLGGDWRERVKRRRAQLDKESARLQLAKESAQTQAEAPVDKNQQPDLAKLSRGLPTGWQIYWDEASKQVYYGNTSTMETTWTRPTQ